MKTLVLIHGAHNDRTVWSPLDQQLAQRGLRVLALDLPGHGASVAPALATVEAMAGWLLGALDQAGIKQALLAGHSMGSLIALEAARLAPQRVAGLALLGSSWPMKVAPALLESALNDEPAALRMVAHWSHSQPAHEAQALAYMERLAVLHPRQQLYTDLNACNSYAGGEAAARALTCPTVFVVGSLDRMTPARASARLIEAIPHATRVEVAAGHQMMAEQPDAVLAALAAFADSAGLAGAA